MAEVTRIQIRQLCTLCRRVFSSLIQMYASSFCHPGKDIIAASRDWTSSGISPSGANNQRSRLRALLHAYCSSRQNALSGFRCKCETAPCIVSKNHFYVQELVHASFWIHIRIQLVTLNLKQAFINLLICHANFYVRETQSYLLILIRPGWWWFGGGGGGG